MRSIISLMLVSAAMVAFAKAEAADSGGEELATEAKAEAAKSIVPSKYAGKYKDGGSDALAEFIKAQCNGKEGFEFPAFFQLCRANGIAEDKVAHYESLVSEKAHGAEGRARMTLRNMLAPIARKNGGLVGLNGEKTEFDLPKPATSGAAAKAKEAAETQSGTDGTAQMEAAE